MKILNKIGAVVLFAALIFTGCTDLDIENLNDPGVEQALGDGSSVKSVLDGAINDALAEHVGLWAVHIDGYADQMTTTNAYIGFWDWTEEPRLRINNDPTYANLDAVAVPWETFNSVISTCNTILQLIDVDEMEMVIDDVDYTDKIKAEALFMRGFSYGYLSMLYDKGYIVDYESEIPVESSDYKALLDEAISTIDEAISLASSTSNFTFDVHSAYSIDATEFVKVANSYLARFMIANARTDAERQELDFDAIKARALKGITEDWAPPVAVDILYNNYQDWSIAILGDGAGYLPLDIKVNHLMDPDYPTVYPDEPTVLDAMVTDDERSVYFGYTSAFGYLNASRNRGLFTNYTRQRYNNSSNTVNLAGLNNQMMLYAEIQYILAECEYGSGNLSAAAAYLNASPRVTVGGLDDVSATADAIENALHYEYSVELDLGAGIGTIWAFMRRYDLLQAGTPLQYPIPATELEITGDDFYSFGGASYTSEVGTADGSNAWTKK